MVSADSLDRPVLCQPWIMDDREPAWLTGNNSLPWGPAPFSGHNTFSQERVGLGGWGVVEGDGTQPWSSHPQNPPSFLIFPTMLFKEQGLHWLQLPRVTGHYQNEI